MTTASPLRRAESVADLRVVRMDLWYSPHQTQPWPTNAGFEEARTLVARAAQTHPAELALNESERSIDEAMGLYAEHVKPTASPMTQGSWDYRVSGLFGSNQYHGSWTGREVPLLVITFAEVAIPFVAPYEERRRDGSATRTLHTILDVLRALNPDDQEHLFGGRLL